jgi:hypothetical protein
LHLQKKQRFYGPAEDYAAGELGRAFMGRAADV